jgi:hypothetical protein
VRQTCVQGHLKSWNCSLWFLQVPIPTKGPTYFEIDSSELHALISDQSVVCDKANGIVKDYSSCLRSGTLAQAEHDRQVSI